MRKIKTSDIVPGVGYAPEKKGLDFLQLSFSELFYALAQTIIGSQIGLTPGTKTYILSGCQRIGTSTSAAYRPGYIYDEATQEIYHFQGTGLNTINTPNGVVLSFVNTI
jgi:ABC-type transport system involved in multi-copper enzyme maturation permease subunit